VLAHTRAQHQCKPQRPATAASTKQAASLCWHTQQPSTTASHNISNNCEHIASSSPVLAHTSAQHQCEPQRHATAEQATNLCWLTLEPCTDASHKGKRQLQAQSEQQTCAGTHKSPAPMHTTKASNLCCLTQEPCTTAGHKGKQQLQAHSEQQACAGSHTSPAPMQATKAGNSCKHRASS